MPGYVCSSNSLLHTVCLNIDYVSMVIYRLVLHNTAWNICAKMTCNILCKWRVEVRRQNLSIADTVDDSV